jgi:ABC-2 type transport system permease protein
MKLNSHWWRFGYLIMMFIIIYGNMVMRSVIEEKPIVLLNHYSSVAFQLNDWQNSRTSLAGIYSFNLAVIDLSLLFAAHSLNSMQHLQLNYLPN